MNQEKMKASNTISRVKQEIAEKYGAKDWEIFKSQSQITPELDKLITESIQWGWDEGYTVGANHNDN